MHRTKILIPLLIVAGMVAGAGDRPAASEEQPGVRPASSGDRCLGACCLPDQSCASVNMYECASLGGTWSGCGTDCSDHNDNGMADVCEQECHGDINHDGFVDVLDFLEVLGAWGPCG